MKICVIAVGKIKEKYFADAISEYAKRISKYADFSITEVAEAPPAKSPEEQRKIEGENLLSKAGGFIIALDGCGTEFTSTGLAGLIDNKSLHGVSEFSFLIGGSRGHGAAVKGKADLIISFGKPTFPHQLFRVMLSEQLYRAVAILNNAPYHK